MDKNREDKEISLLLFEALLGIILLRGLNADIENFPFLMIMIALFGVTGRKLIIEYFSEF